MEWGRDQAHVQAGIKSVQSLPKTLPLNKGAPQSDSRTVTDKTPDHIRQHYFAPLRPVKGV